MDAIVAVYSDWGIGAEGTQPIVIPEDRRPCAKLKSDAYFPNLDSLPDWKCVEEEPFTSGEYQCSFCTYERVD